MGEGIPRLKFPLVQVQGMFFQVVGNEFPEGILKVKGRMDSEVWALEHSWKMPYLLLREMH